MSFWKTKEDELSHIGETAPLALKDYKCPRGLFDQAATGKPGPMPVMEVEDSWLRMEVFRKTLAGLVAQHVFLCVCAAAGHVMNQIGLKLPAYVLLVSGGLSVVVYFALWFKTTRYPMNLYFLIAFSVCFGLYIVDSVTTQQAAMPADILFILTLALILMLLYSLPSFCCDLSLFDIKSAGFLGYCFCIFLASVVGLAAGTKMHPTNMMHAMIPAVASGIWMFCVLLSIYTALGYFREGHVVPIMAFAWVWPVDWIFKTTQLGCRKLESLKERN